jgi:exopolyphosphatase/guanosine-5'-triphosphate,3'-diphosphate pyrophosphatase
LGDVKRAGKIPRLPLEDAKARLKRIGVIDVGSNSVRLVVFDGVGRSPAYVYNEKVLAGLGQGLADTSRLSPEGWIRAMAALRRFAALGRRMGVSGMIAVATAAVREAVDGPAFCDAAERETGLQIHVASGGEEARLAAKGVLLAWPRAEGLVCDMGGASMELAHLDHGVIGDCATSPLGPLKLADLDGQEAVDKAIRKGVKALRKSVPGPAPRLFLVGGSWRAIARIHMERLDYPLKVLHGYAPSAPELLETLAWIREQDQARLAAVSGGSSSQRLSLVPLASQVLAELVRRIEPGRITISAFGLREGLLFRQMPEAMRELDPLIEAARHMETHLARAPGFGDALFAWLGSLYEGRRADELRLIQAACLMHDINWRAHPDHRGELAFETVMRSNVAGVNHAERVFIGLALLNRYKGSVGDDEIGRYGAIIPPALAGEAAVLGRAMRLGAMISGAAVGVLEHAALRVEGPRLLRLILRGEARDFAGEAVDRRLASLASKLNLEPEIALEEELA